MSSPLEDSKKEPCKYGAACYRQNPHHFEQFSHPPQVTGKRALNPNEASTSASSSSSTPNKKSKKVDDKDNEQAKPEVKLNLANVSELRYEFGQEEYPPAKLSDNPDQFGFHLTTVFGACQRDNLLVGGRGGIQSVGIKNILNEATGELVASAQFSYMFDIEWLLEQYPPTWRQCPLYVVHGVKAANDRLLSDTFRPHKQVISCPVLIRDPYGTHHTKMMLLHYKHGLRVVIHTANMMASDWKRRTQGVWISPVFPPVRQQSPLKEEEVEASPSNFKNDLVEYLRNYRNTPGIDMWIKTIQRHNMSSAKVFLIGSVPGRHRETARSSYGHLKLRRVLAGAYGPPPKAATWPVVAQFSSVGSLGPDASKWLYGQFISSMSQISTVNALAGQHLLLQKPPLKCIFPTVENVRLSLDGYFSGANLPYSSTLEKRQTYLRAYLHQWKAGRVGRTEASPHIKTYCRLSVPDKDSGDSDTEGDKSAWFLLTSANLSKAAWGELQTGGSQLAIRSFELGVLFLPKLLCGTDYFTTRRQDSAKPNYLPLPYDTPLTPYEGGDEPWTWDTFHTDKPDRNGMLWVPEIN